MCSFAMTGSARVNVWPVETTKALVPLLCSEILDDLASIGTSKHGTDAAAVAGS
jgi:hypothetical protein